jgi:hypothetical protein
MSIPKLFVARMSSTMYQLFYTLEVKTDSLHFYKISPAHIAVIQNIKDCVPPSTNLISTLLRHWEGDTILQSNWKYTDSKISIERPDGLVLSNLPILFFENSNEILPFKMCFVKTFVQVSHQIPLHVRIIVLEDAIRKAATCPISFEPITMKSVVTSCGHVFDEESIKKWLSTPSSNRACAVCKQTCTI